MEVSYRIAGNSPYQQRFHFSSHLTVSPDDGPRAAHTY